MGGGILQVVAIGAQDTYLTGNPQITFFKAVYRRHTNFSIESVKQTLNGTANFGQEINCTIQRNGDLISRAYFQTTLPSIDVGYGITDNTRFNAFRWLNYIGHILIKEVEISIGGSRIDKQYGEWFHIWNELSQSYGKKSGYSEMVGNVPKLSHIYSTNSPSSKTECKTDEYTLYIPLEFWFCRNPGMALPHIALQYHDVIINMELRTLDECIWATTQTRNTNGTLNFKPTSTGSNVLNSSAIQLSKSSIYIDYIYLDTDERRRFAQVPHEYLIEQLQFTGDETIVNPTHQVKLNFTHPIKEIIWVVQPTNFTEKNYTQSRAGRQYYNYSDLWDYSGFSGTPENTFGSGMVGGRNSQNLMFGTSPVKVEGELNTNNLWSININESSPSRENAGYNNVSHYNELNRSYKPNNRRGIWSLLTDTTMFDHGNNPIKSAKIVLNGNDRFTEREGKYFNVVQPYQHHTNCPAVGINVYSFSITPEDHQPSGSCNFSKIDNAILQVTLSDKAINKTYNTGFATIRVFAINYNILRIMSGMGGLAYSN
jgi:hypothetical protein